MPDSQHVICAQGLGKRYQLGLIHTDLLSEKLTEGVGWVLGGIGRLLGREPQESVLHAKHSQADRDYLWALRDVTFHVKQGEVLGIVGRNGAGKSTLLKLLTGVTQPTEGEVWMKGRIGSLLEVGTGFHPELTGRENIYMNGAMLGMRKAEITRNFDEIVDFSGVGKFIDTPVKRYSSGMYVRLAFGVAAHLEPEILLVDEVLAVGDAEFQKKCLGKMGEVAKAGRTVLFVSHNMFSLRNLCTRGMLIKDGRIAAEGAIHDVIDTYLDTRGEHTGEATWPNVEKAPGDHRTKLKAVRVTCEGKTAGEVDMAKAFEIGVDYENYDAGARRTVTVHLHN